MTTKGLAWEWRADCNCLNCIEARGYEAGSAADPRSVLGQIYGSQEEAEYAAALSEYAAQPNPKGFPPIKRYGRSPADMVLPDIKALNTIQDRIGDAAARKATPLFSGCINYFPDALLAVAELSNIGNEQHNPGSPLHWDRSKSGDEKDALARHLVDAGTLDTDGVRHSAKVAWRALANLQKEIEAERERD